MVGPAQVRAARAAERQMLEELLALPHTVERLARLAELRQGPGGRADRRVEQDADVAAPLHGERVLGE